MNDDWAKQVAQSIFNADFLLITAGAGASADSGIPVFAAVGKEEVYKKQGLTYNTIVTPDCLVKNPKIFYGFFKQSIDLYLKTEPHQGYNIMKEWADFISKKKSDKQQPQSVYIMTSNVDGFFKRVGFLQDEICEVHGQINKWQCGGKPEKKGKIKIQISMFESQPCKGPLFPVEIEKMIVDTTSKELTTDFPKCPHCGGLARPNIFLFGDGTMFQDESESGNKLNFTQWSKEITDYSITQKNKNNKKKSIVILEIGCGLRVPSCRKKDEELKVICNDKNILCSFIRINPDYPKNKMIIDPDYSVKLGGLNALKEIQVEFKKLVEKV